MKSCKILLPIITFVMLAGILGTSSGCRSTGNWGPTGWFASREPDASKLAGRGGVPQLPTSPSLNHSPTALASKAAEKTPSASSEIASGERSLGSPVAGAGAEALNPNRPAAPGPSGLAARANGYQTGPYGMSSAPYPSASLPSASSTEMPTRTASTVGSPVLNGASSAESASFPSPYGGSYTGYTPPSSTPSTSLPNFGAGVNASGSPDATGAMNPMNAMNSMGPMPTTGFGPAMPVSAASAAALPEYPSLPTGVPSSSPNASNTHSGLGVSPSQFPPLPTMNTSVTDAVNNSFTSPTSAAGAAGGVPAASAYQSSMPSGNFAPGTTGRTTTYNFGISDGAGAAASPGSSLPGLPPNTATSDSPLLR